MSSEPEVQHTQHSWKPSGEVAWEEIETKEHTLPTGRISRRAPSTSETLIDERRKMREELTNTMNNFLKEGLRQYHWSFRSASAMAVSGGKNLRFGLRHFYTLLLQPVWVPRRNKEPKQYSRLSLFLLDTIRFGGTFAVIFTALFVSLNYQSFWSILTTHINPIDHARNVQALTASVDTALREKLMRSPALATAGKDG